MGDYYCELAGDAGQKHVCFGRHVVTGLSSGDAHVDLQVIDRSLHDSPDFVKRNPLIRVSLDSGEHAETQVFVSVCSPSFFGSAARVFTFADPLTIYHMYFGTAPFNPVRTSFFFCDAAVFHGK